MALERARTRTHLVRPISRRRRWTAGVRQLRAAWHDTAALWREFRRPVLLFLLVIIGGGFIYGELYYRAYGEYYALDVRPYLMLQLMIMESPSEVPSEWFLIIFWYLLPPLGVFILGLGAADFLRLFFNRHERRDAWGEAVALSFRNHVIVFGAGHVGLRVIRELAAMAYDVVVIDNSPDPGVDDELNQLNVPLIVADGRLTTTLEKAQLRDARAFLACTGNDHVNLEVVMKARDLNPAVRIVARAWDTQFANQIERFMNVQAVLSSSDLSAPAFAGAAVGIDITQILRVNSIEYSTVRLNVEPGSFLDGATVGKLQMDNDMDIVLYGRGERVEVQPSRDMMVVAGDILVIFARHDRILSVIAGNRSKQDGKKN
ncbi:MAG: TrkA family potassium uptake protein [Anaerolineae bacterium]|nr:TrkA family potassium uptake protein [Anaerolineae bacterium]